MEHKKLENISIVLTQDNFYDFFAVEYVIGERKNYGAGTIVSQEGYDIDWDYYGCDVTLRYDYDVYNDYAVPVYIYIAPKYHNLFSRCKFDMGLHQIYTENGVGEHDFAEYAYQQGTIEYDSSMGIGEYCILVEDSDGSNRLLSLFGMGIRVLCSMSVQ